jgi:signal transduction histidine kinase
VRRGPFGAAAAAAALLALESAGEPDREPWAQTIPEASDDAGSREPFRPPTLLEAVPRAETVVAADGESHRTDALARLAGALSHEVRNPLATIRTFAELLPERFEDPEFRDRFAETVKSDVDRIDGLVERLAELAALETPRREAVDVSALLEDLLDERRELIRERRLLVLKELDANHPMALCDAAQLRFALEALLGRSLELVPDRGDVYLASRQHAPTGTSGPSVRALVRFHAPGSQTGSPVAGLSLVENSLELLIAEIVIRAQDGSLAIVTEGEETVIVIDLPSPAPG